MPKVTMTFNLPDEEPELLLAQNGHKYACVIDELHEALRQKSKYENKTVIKIEDVRNLLNELCDQNDVL